MTKIAFQPGPKITALLDQQQWTDLSPIWPTAAVTGSGGTSATLRRLAVDTGVSATSTALRRTGSDTCWSIGQGGTVLDWTKRIVLHFIIRAVGTTNGVSRISLGKTTGDGMGNLARKGIGIRLDNLAVKGQAHNGTDLATVDLSTTLTGSNTYRLSITSDGAGNIEWFVDGVSKGSSTGGPSALGTAGESVIQIEADNGGDAAQQYLQIADAKLYVEQ